LSFVGTFSTWLGLLAMLATVAVLVTQFLSRGSYVHAFTESDWKRIDGTYEIRIPHCHGKGKSPTVAAFQTAEDGSLEEVVLDVRTERDGSVILGAALPFAGEARIG
jgi:hypothetical protein